MTIRVQRRRSSEAFYWNGSAEEVPKTDGVLFEHFRGTSGREAVLPPHLVSQTMWAGLTVSSGTPSDWPR